MSDKQSSSAQAENKETAHNQSTIDSEASSEQAGSAQTARKQRPLPPVRKPTPWFKVVGVIIMVIILVVIIGFQFVHNG